MRAVVIIQMVKLNGIKKKKECVVSHPLDNKHKETFNNLMNLSQTKSEVSPFVDLEGPIHSKVKNGSLGSKVNESCSIANIDLQIIILQKIIQQQLKDLMGFRYNNYNL